MSSQNMLYDTLPCDKYHHYYHYQSSAQYLWLAETLLHLGRVTEAGIAYDKALFQDHFNKEALEGKKTLNAKPQGTAPIYDKHPICDKEFCISIGKEPTTATELHDNGVLAFIDKDYVNSISYFNQSLIQSPSHSNSYFTRSKCWFMLEEYEKAYNDLNEAIRLSHIDHDHYHRIASNAHLLRGRKFLERGAIDLAIADFTKALDLDCHNQEANEARKSAYLQKRED